MLGNISNTSNPLATTNGKYYLILFLLWPFLALVTAISNYSHKESRKVVYIYLIYFGLTFITAGEGLGYVDAQGYAMQLKANAALPFSDFFKIVGGLYATDTSVDIIEPLISFIVSRFTGNSSILFAVYAAIFGFFYLKSINLLYQNYRKNPRLNGLIHLAFFSIILPITSINGFRMWTAAWIFFYGAYHVILHRDVRYLIIAAISSLAHFSFLSANVILLIYFFVGNRNFIYLPLAVVSFVVPHFIKPLLQTISLRLSGGLANRYESYTDEANVLVRQEDFQTASWFLKIGNDLVYYYLIIAIILMQVKSRRLRIERSEKNLFSFLLLFISFVNFGIAIPSFGARFQVVFFLFATSYILLNYIKYIDKKVSILTWFGLFPMLLYTAVKFRTTSGCIDAWIFTPGFGLPLLVPGVSLYNLLFN